MRRGKLVNEEDMARDEEQEGNHFWLAVINKIWEKMKGYSWQKRVVAFEEALESKIKEPKVAVKALNASNCSNNVVKCLCQVCRKTNKSPKEDEKDDL